MLQLADVVKSYGEKRAVDNVSFVVPQGKIFGLLGPNGAGKTTLIRIITHITRPDSGAVYFKGERLSSRHPERIGYLPEERGLYRKMRVGEHLLYLARLKGMPAREARQSLDFWLDRFEITHWWDKKVETLSKGMQQKMQFISTVIHRPELIILDEPFSGLDPINTNLIKEEIMNLHKQGCNIIFSTHRMEQVEELCERIVLIHHGQNVLEGDLAEVRHRYKQNLFQFAFSGALPAGMLGGVEVVSQAEGEVTIKADSPAQANRLLGKLLAHDLYVQSFQEIFPSLNEIFIRVVGEEGRRLLMGEPVAGHSSPRNQTEGS